MSDYSALTIEIEELLLPEGRLDPEEVEISQRRRLMLALALESHRTGYEVVSIDTVADSAMLSKATLYAQFGSKRGLLEAAVDEFTEESKDEIAVAAKAESDWVAAIAAGVDALVEVVVTDPALARLAFVEAPAILAGRGRPGERADFAALGHIFTVADGLAGEPAGRFDEVTRLATLGGMAAPLADCLIRGRSEAAWDLIPSLTYLAVNSRLGPAVALEAVA